MPKVKEIIQKVREAQKIFGTFTQEQVDKIFYEAAWAANNARIPLAKLAVEDTKMGIVEDKILKNHVASEFIYNKYKDMKTVGVYKEDQAAGAEWIYEPMGVIGAIIPTTNPTSTAIFKCLLALKTRNGIVISPHPRAYKCTTEAARIILEAAVKAGAPEGIIAWLPQNSTLEDTTTLMKETDIILATGGGGLVKAAYSSGTPAIGVGAGNCPAIIDDSANVPMAVASIIQSNTFDNGVLCPTENSVIVLKSNYKEVIEEFKKQYAHVITDPVQAKKIGKKMFKEGAYGLLNPAMVGQNPQVLGKLFGIKVPENAKILVVEAKSTSYDEPLAHEKLSTFVSLYVAKDFDDALKIQSELLLLGPGHTSSIFVDEWKHPEKVAKFRNSAKTARCVVNSPSCLGGVGDMYNFAIEPSLTLGCGTWGGNIFSENIGPQHLLNKKQVAKRRENMLWLQLPSKIYYKYGCLPEALKDLKDDGVKRVFVVTDSFIWSMVGAKLTKILENLGISIDVFSGVEPNPTLSTTLRAVKQLNQFNPQAIIAIGGGSSLDAAKLMWIYNEYPDLRFQDLALRFADIRKRIVKFPKVGSKCKLVCIPTTSGTGSEVTPFAIITDDKTHVKYSLADYSLTPNTAIVDAQFMMSLPPRMTAITGADALSHCFESYVSVLATEFTRPYSLEGIKLIFKYLERCYKNGNKDKEAREAMAHAATIAGIAFANAFLGVVHSLSHKIGGHFGVAHGAANAIYLPYVIAYNSEKGVKEKQMYWSQYETHNVRDRYCEIADALGIKGKNQSEKITKLIAKVQELFKAIELWPSTQAYGVKDQEFEDILDQMAEEAFDDQCTAANPRYPSIKDFKELFKEAHYGKPVRKITEK